MRIPVELPDLQAKTTGDSAKSSRIAPLALPLDILPFQWATPPKAWS